MNFSSSGGNYESLFAFLMAYIGFMLFFVVLFYIVTAIADLKIFKKAGYAGWKAFIPFYSTYILCKILFGPEKGWYFIFFMIPYVSSVFACIAEYKLGRTFNQSTGFCVLSIFIAPINRFILGFGSAEYQGPTVLFS